MHQCCISWQIDISKSKVKPTNQFPKTTLLKKYVYWETWSVLCFVYNVGFSTFFPLRNQNGYNFNPSPVHKLFLFSQTKMQQHFLGVCFKTNSQYIPSLVSPLTSFKKKRKRKQNRKRKNTYRNQFYSDIVVDVYTHGIFPLVLFVMKFACLSIKCGRALMQDACSKYLILGPDSIGSPS